MKPLAAFPPRPPRQVTSWRVSLMTSIVLLLVLALQSVFVSTTLRPMLPSLHPRSLEPPSDMSSSTSSSPISSSLPLFIYRRTRKTGSSSMLAALLDVLLPLSYHALYNVPEEMPTLIRAEVRKPQPRPLLIAQHNHIKRSIHPKRHALIADTFRDGYDQITSFCRYVRKLSRCDDADMVSCVQDATTRAQISYRWAGNSVEDDDTYIDIPLSSSHPALSSAALSLFFGNVSLQIHQYNVHNSSCPDVPAVRNVYNRHYKLLDDDNRKLAKRLLVLAGYTILLDSSIRANVSVYQLLDAAERIERQRIQWEQHEVTETKRLADSHNDLNQATRKWVLDSKGVLQLRRRF